MAVLSRLLPTLVTSYLVQTASGLVSIPLQSELFFDFTGAVGFLASTFVSLFYNSIEEGRPLASKIQELSTRQLLLNGAIVVWSTRLGLLLFLRALRLRKDSRFDAVRPKPLKFATKCLMQATWVFLIGLPVYLANTLRTSRQLPLGPKDYIPLGLFTSAFLLQVLADLQKSRWQNRREKGRHGEKSLSSGLWNWARHSNYASEIGVWLGIWAVASSALQHSPYPRLAPVFAAVSPLLTWHFVTSSSQHVLGFPWFNRHARSAIVDDTRFKEYIRRIPLLWW